MRLTSILLLIIFIGLVLYDVVAYYFEGWAGTISATLIEVSKKYPFIPFLAGALASHLWWRAPCG